jgi:hypothetical protein
MRRLLTWLAVSLGIAALARRLRRMRTARARGADPEARVEDPADELRRKLAEARIEAMATVPAAPETVEERRAEVHDQGRSALEEMREGDEG